MKFLQWLGKFAAILAVLIAAGWVKQKLDGHKPMSDFRVIDPTPWHYPYPSIVPKPNPEPSTWPPIRPIPPGLDPNPLRLEDYLKMFRVPEHLEVMPRVVASE